VVTIPVVIVLVCFFIFFLFEFEGLLSREIIIENGPGQLIFSYEALTSGGSHTSTNITLKCAKEQEMIVVDSVFDILL
jgi:hypothetical protein